MKGKRFVFTTNRRLSHFSVTFITFQKILFLKILRKKKKGNKFRIRTGSQSIYRYQFSARSGKKIWIFNVTLVIKRSEKPSCRHIFESDIPTANQLSKKYLISLKASEQKKKKNVKASKTIHLENHHLENYNRS